MNKSHGAFDQHQTAQAEDVTTLRQAILRQLDHAPNRIVFFDQAGDVSASDLLDRVGVIADWLLCHLPRGDRTSASRPVGLMLHDNSLTIAAIVACWQLRTPPLILDHRLSAEDIQNWKDRCGLTCIITQAKRRTAAVNGVAVLDPISEMLSSPTRVARGRRLLSRLSGLSHSSDDIAEYITSSGVAGPPKVYPVSQKRALANIRLAAEDFARGEWGAALGAISVVFGGARLIWWRNLLYGKPVRNFPLLFSVAELDKALQDERIEECTLPPHLIRALVALARRDGASSPRYPHLIKLQSIGGPALPDDKLDAQRLLSSRYTMTYSSTETGVVSRIEGEDLMRRPASCGRPQGEAKLEIVDANDHPQPVGVTGRIRLTWPTTTSRDDNAPAHRAYPGDLGWLDDEGFLYISGRGDGIICRNGVNFSTSALLAKLLRHDGVLDAALLRLNRAEGDDDFALAIHADPTSDIDDLGVSIRRVLSTHEQPAMIIAAAVDEVTVAGKIAQSTIVNRITHEPTKLTLI